jgi:pimeloyl-ACP methyl ester carboxylesterase
MKPNRRLLIGVVLSLALLGAAFLLWQRNGPRSERFTHANLPEELVHVRAKDDIVNGGAIFFPSNNLAKPMAIIWIHGWGVNFYCPSYINIGRALAERGYTCITANTRMHDLGNVEGYRGGKRIRGGGYWGVASEEVRDLAAWIDFAEERGFKKVVLVGHSAGWAAVRAETRPTDQDQLVQATNMLAAGRPDDLIRDPKRSFPSFISAATFMDIAQTPAEQKDFFGMRTETQSPGVTRILCPLLAFFGTRESEVGTEKELEQLKTSIARLANGPRRVETAIIQRADHMYNGEEAQVAEVIAKWAGALTNGRP